jgi:serine/threonine protein phosphatase PrpC
MLKNSGIDYSSSGTCVLAILIINDKCYSINLGDSRAVMYKESAFRKIAFELTYDHRPTRIDEKQRILKNNGKISKIL